MGIEVIITLLKYKIADKCIDIFFTKVQRNFSVNKKNKFSCQGNELQSWMHGERVTVSDPMGGSFDGCIIVTLSEGQFSYSLYSLDGKDFLGWLYESDIYVEFWG